MDENVSADTAWPVPALTRSHLLMAAEAPPQALSTSGNFRRRLGDRALRLVAGLAAVVLAVVMVLLVYDVFDQARPAISQFGVGFLTGTEWNAVTDKFGALDLIWGTLATSLIALLIAVPIAIAIALFLTELAPGVLRTPVGMLVELLAAIPSVVLGLWGIVVMGPFLNEHVEPWMIAHLGFIPFLDGYPSPVGSASRLSDPDDYDRADRGIDQP